MVLNILLVLLKAIGIILLCLLLLVIALLLMVLFVPLRYRLQMRRLAEEKDSTFLSVRVTYLLNLLQAEYTVLGQERGLKIRIAWHVLGQRKKHAGKKTKANQKKSKGSKGSAKGAASSEAAAQAEQTQLNTANVPAIAQHSDVNDDPWGDEFWEETEPQEEKLTLADNTDDTTGKNGDGKTQHKTSATRKPDATRKTGTDRKSDATRKTGTNRKSGATGRLRDRAATFTRRLRGAFKTLRRIPEVIASLPQILAEVFLDILMALDGAIDAEDRLYGRYEKLRARLRPLTDLSATKGYRKIIRELKKLFGFYKIRKIQGWLRFGTGRPDLTGQATGLIYLVLPENSKQFELIPEFNERAAEGEFTFAGKVATCHVAASLIRLLLSKDVRKLLGKIRRVRRGD